jgi:hypothetical protein
MMQMNYSETRPAQEEGCRRQTARATHLHATPGGQARRAAEEADVIEVEAGLQRAGDQTQEAPLR